MRFIKRLIIAIAVISFPIIAYGTEFTIEGPNHHDFLRLVDEKPYLEKSLYHVPTNHYYGPETLAMLNIRYEMYVKGYIKYFSK